jgi:hypothetical protein
MSMHDFHRRLESNDQEFKSFRELAKKRPDEVLKVINPFMMFWQWF